MATAPTVLVFVGVSATVAVAVGSTMGVGVAVDEAVAELVGLGDSREVVAVAADPVAVKMTVGVGVDEGLGVLVGDAVGVGVDDGTIVSVGAGEGVGLGVDVRVAVEVAARVDVGERVGVWVGDAVGAAVSTNARVVGVDCTWPAGWSTHPDSPRTVNKASIIASCCQAKTPPAGGCGFSLDGFGLIRLKCVTGHGHKRRRSRPPEAKPDWPDTTPAFSGNPLTGTVCGSRLSRYWR